MSLPRSWLSFPFGNNTSQEKAEEQSQDTPTDEDVFTLSAIIFLGSIAFLFCFTSCAHFLHYSQHRNRERQQVKEREVRIRKSLVTKKVLSHSSIKKEILVSESTIGAKEEEEEEEEEVSVKQKSDHADINESSIIDPALSNDKEICSICLERLEAGEKVSWSKTAECNHVFHFECISPWLQKNEYCPCCRCQYLLDESQICTKPDEKELHQSLRRLLGVLKIHARSSQAHPTISEKEEQNSEIMRTRYMFCVDHGLFLPGGKDTSPQKERSSSEEDQRADTLTLNADYGTDDHVESARAREINENMIEDGSLCPAVDSSISGIDEK